MSYEDCYDDTVYAEYVELTNTFRRKITKESEETRTSLDLVTEQYVRGEIEDHELDDAIEAALIEDEFPGFGEKDEKSARLLTALGVQLEIQEMKNDE